MTISIEDSINKENTENTNERKSTFKINSFILNRWSPRSMSGEELDEDTIMSLFEAARWAPSSYTIINHGDLSMLKETQTIGVNYLIC
jgi:hypothetical protein